MEKKVICALCVLLAVFCLMSFGSEPKGEYIRIHIRANSNSEEDQNVKLKVRDEITEYLTPVVSSCETFSSSCEAVERELRNLSEIASGVLSENGFSYGAVARLKKEHFPARTYQGQVFPEGEYESLIIELGTGEGDNWWCVLYPPLCFVPTVTDGKNVVYKSKIVEIIESFKRRNDER